MLDVWENIHIFVQVKHVAPIDVKHILRLLLPIVMAVVLFNGTDGSDSTCMKNQTYGMDIETAFFQTEEFDMVAELVAMHQSVSCNGFRTPKILRKRGSTHNHRLYFFRSYRIYLVDRQFFHNLLPRSTYYFTKSTDMLIRFGKLVI